MPLHVPLQSPSGVTTSHAPSHCPMQTPPQDALAPSSHDPTQLPSQKHPCIVQSIPAGPVLPPSAVPSPVDAFDALLVLLAPGPSLVPGPVEASLDPSELESSVSSSPHAATSSKPVSASTVDGARRRIAAGYTAAPRSARRSLAVLGRQAAPVLAGATEPEGRDRDHEAPTQRTNRSPHVNLCLSWGPARRAPQRQGPTRRRFDCGASVFFEGAPAPPRLTSRTRSGRLGP